MISFRDGPAKGLVLQLRRAPLFLRVVKPFKGEWDALDQLDDEPRKGEHIFVYRLASAVGTVCIRGGKGRGCYPLAEYAYLAEQPADDQVRTTEAWRAWVEQQPKDQTSR